LSLIIRNLKLDDKPEWVKLWRSYLEYYKTSLSNEVFHQTFARLLDTNLPKQNGLIAIKDNKPVGIVHFIYHPHNWRIEDVCYLQDLYTDPNFRGLGIGRSLMEAVYKAADANNTPNVYWLTEEFNQTARQLYDQVGRLTPFIKYQR
jgi:GNAT superfamily N-acetyltransferase